MEMLAEIFEVCIIPLLGVLTAYFVKFINAKSAELATKSKNEIERKYINMLNDTITDCVIATTQTYVDALKKECNFGLEAQSVAFMTTKEAILKTLSEEAKAYLTAVYGDLDEYLNQRIEAQV